MKKFETPVIEIEAFGIIDVIATSGCDVDCVGFDCPTDTGCEFD